LGSIDNGSPNIYQYLFHVDFTTPSNSTFTGVGRTKPVPGVASFRLACGGFGACIPQPGVTDRLDSLGDRLMYRLAYRNFSADHQTWLVSHSVTAGSSVGERWYEFRAPENSTSLSVYQQGTFAPDSNYRWMGWSTRLTSFKFPGCPSAGSGTVTLSAYSVNFGNQTLGQPSSPQPVTLTNNQSVPLSSITISTSGDYSQTNNCGLSLNPNSSCTIYVVFTPSQIGTRTGTLTVNDNGPGDPHTASLTGVGAPPVVTVTSPQNNAQVSGTVTVSASAPDDPFVASMQVFVDSVMVAQNTTSNTINYSWDTTTYSNGKHTIYATAYDAAGNVGTSPTITVTVIHIPSQLIQNGGFENGNPTNWSAGGVYLPFVVTGHAHSGKYSTQLGASSGSEPNGDSSLYQTITIPSTVTNATLTFWYWASTTTTMQYDWQEAQVQNSSGTVLAQLMKLSSNTHTWTQRIFNLTPYKGQTIRIYFNDHQGGRHGNLTYMYLDDVSVVMK